jgi:hypothetical protein
VLALLFPSGAACGRSFSQATSWELTEHFGGSQVIAGKWRAPLDEIHFAARIGYQGRAALVRWTR